MHDFHVYLKINKKTTLSLVCLHEEITHVNCLPTSLFTLLDHCWTIQHWKVCFYIWGGSAPKSAKPPPWPDFGPNLNHTPQERSIQGGFTYGRYRRTLTCVKHEDSASACGWRTGLQAAGLSFKRFYAASKRPMCLDNIMKTSRRAVACLLMNCGFCRSTKL